MERLQQAIGLATSEFIKRNGEDVKLEDGEQFTTVFNDGLLIMGFEDSELKINFIIGKPGKVDFDLMEV